MNLKSPWPLTDQLKNVVDLIAQTAKPKQIILFGSRARGTYRENSDVDLCVKGKRCSESVWIQLLLSIENEPYTLMKIDLVEYELLNENYHNEIKKDGIILYESNT